jgi:hypothetical protein
MADDVTQPKPEVSASVRRRPGALQRRFHLAYFFLAVVLGVGAGALVVLLARGGPDHSPWSDWKPAGRGLAATQEIASQVGKRYRLPSGNQLVGIIAKSPELEPEAGRKVPVSAVAISSGLPDERTDEIKVFRANDSILYILCGVGGEACSIPGQPTTERMTLLRREGLELALYTFKYVKGVSFVIAIVPPRQGQQPSTALFFRRGDYGDSLTAPLGDTLPARERLTPGSLPTGEETRVKRLTLADPVKERFSGIYAYQFQPLPDATAMVVLSPVA